jgi:hypothetical protein
MSGTTQLTGEFSSMVHGMPQVQREQRHPAWCCISVTLLKLPRPLKCFLFHSGAWSSLSLMTTQRIIKPNARPNNFHNVLKILFLGIKNLSFYTKPIFLMIVNTGHMPLLRTCALLEKQEHCFSPNSVKGQVLLLTHLLQRIL